jgi:hypothetical protein
MTAAGAFPAARGVSSASTSNNTIVGIVGPNAALAEPDKDEIIRRELAAVFHAQHCRRRDQLLLKASKTQDVQVSSSSTKPPEYESRSDSPKTVADAAGTSEIRVVQACVATRMFRDEDRSGSYDVVSCRFWMYRCESQP